MVEQLPNFQYQLFFASPESTPLIDANVRVRLNRLYALTVKPFILRQVEKFINLIYASARQYASGEAAPFEKAGVIEAWLKDETKSVTSELLSKEVRAN